jgi:hypothetical protein
VSWKLFLDDDRNPVRNDWVIARSSAEAIKQVVKRGMPAEIAFDHDLGGDDTTMRFVNWLTDQLLDQKLRFPRDFQYSIHSQNSVGARNIANRMNSLLDHFGRE